MHDIQGIIAALHCSLDTLWSGPSSLEAAGNDWMGSNRRKGPDCARRAGKAKSKIPKHSLHWLYTGSDTKTCLGSVKTNRQ